MLIIEEDIMRDSAFAPNNDEDSDGNDSDVDEFPMYARLASLSLNEMSLLR